MSKNSIKINSMAWLSQQGTGDIIYFPLVQSSSFETSYSRVTHKGIGSRSNVGYYRYKDDNIILNIGSLASNERTFGTSLTRENFATENYVSGEITGYDLSGCKSVLYGATFETGNSIFNFYSLIDDRSEQDLAFLSGYSGFFAKFEDCLLSSLSIQAEVGSYVSVDAEYSAQDVSFLRTGISYISGINEYHEVVHPKNVMIYLGEGDSDAVDVSGFNVSSINIDLPIEYKYVESFGSSKPSNRKLMLPAVGKITLDGLASEFQELSTSFLDASEKCYNMTVLLRSTIVGTTNSESDYLVIKFPKIYLSSESIDGSVGDRLGKSLSFTFFESADEYSSGKEGMYFLRKIPDTVTYFAE